MDAPDLVGSWSRRRFLAAAAAAPFALWLPLPPGTITRILHAHGAAGTTYYVSRRGNDANRGTSPLEAWRTIARVNQARFGPGDMVLFEGGQTFTGMLHITDSGTAAAPISIGSYGTERATLARNGGKCRSTCALTVRLIDFRCTMTVGGRMATKPRIVRKNLHLDRAKLDRAKEILGTATETETVEQALDMIIFHHEVRRDPPHRGQGSGFRARLRQRPGSLRSLPAGISSWWPEQPLPPSHLPPHGIGSYRLCDMNAR